MWEIKGKDNTVKSTVNALEYNGEWMGECYVSVTVESPEPVNFEIGDYLMYRGERFEINYDPGKIKSAPRFAKGDAFKYENIKFNSLADELTRCDFLDVVLADNQLHFTGLPKFSFYGNVQDLANRMQANLDRTYGKNTWSVVVSSEYTDRTEINVSVDTIKVQGALEILVNQFKAYYTIKGRTITIGAAGIPAGHLFKYGKGNGLYEIEQNAEADQAIVTRLRAYGSTRNLPHRYYNSLTGADGNKLIPDNMAVQNLMLPSFPYTTQDPYIDSANKAALGIREGTIFFDGSQEGLEEIYPSIEGMTAEDLHKAGVQCNATGVLDVLVSAEQMTDNGVGRIEGENNEAEPPTFKVTLKDLGFNLWEHRIAGTAPVISFKTGKLGGRDFEIVDCKKEGNNYILELNRVYDDGIKLWFPYKDYNATTGDKFVLLHIEMPEVYIKAASQRLLTAATEWLSNNDYSRSIYAPKIDEIFMARQHDEAMASGGTIKSLHDTLKEGMLLLFEDEDLNIDASIFIDRLTIKEGDGPVPTYEVVLKEEKTVGRLDKMQNQIDSLVSGKGQGGVGGYTASQIRTMIEAYGSTRFLSKLKDDRAAGKIASDLGFEIGQYLAGVSGGMFGIDKESGDSFAEVSKLWVRGKAYFETLTIIEASTLAGKQYITPGGSIRCTKVEEIKNESGAVTAYRCYFLSEQDGDKTETKIIAGDQVISEMFNAKTGTANKVSNHRYWRLVTDVDNDAYTDDSGNRYGYIALSATDCEQGSDKPQAGDTIVQFGNRTDTSRQTAMVFSTVDSDAPSIKLFTGIGSGETNAQHYSLASKDIVSYGYDHVKGHAFFNCYGDTYIGDPDGFTFIKYDQDAKQLDVKAKLSIQSTIGDKTLGELIEGYDASEYLRKALPQDTDITGGVVLSTLLSLGYKDEAGLRHTLSGMNGAWNIDAGEKTIAAWYGGDMFDRFDTLGNLVDIPTGTRPAASLFRMDGSGYLANGNWGWRADGSGWLGKKDGILIGNDGSLTLGNGLKIEINGSAASLADTVANLFGVVNGLVNHLYPVDKDGNKLAWSAPEIHAIKAVKTLFSAQGVSARGLSETQAGGGTGGSSTLGGLTDVTLGTLKSGDALVYDGTKWTNQPVKVGIDETELATYLNANGYLKQSALGNYYTKSEADGLNKRLTTYYESRPASANVNFGNKTGLYTFLATSSMTEGKPAMDAHILHLEWDNGLSWGAQIAVPALGDMQWRFQNGTVWQNWRTLLDSENYASVLDNSYVRKVGDTMSGLLKISSAGWGQQLTVHRTNGTASIYFHNAITEAGYIYFENDNYFHVSGNGIKIGSSQYDVWHSGNDGSGSGLDADTLDGQHLSDIQNGNVRTASYLQYGRKLWGQYFNGGNDVSGDMSGIGLMTFATGHEIYATSGEFAINRDSNTRLITILNNGYVGFGTSSPQYELHVAGDIRADGWLRTAGATGWYNDDYGGGWFMRNSTYIENYGVKRVKLIGPQSYYDLWLVGGGICFEGYAGTGWNGGFGCINAGIPDNANQTPLVVAYRNGEAFQNCEPGRLFSMELLNNGSQVWLNFGGENRFKFWATGELYAQAGVWSNGYISTRGQNTGSDIRLKDILGDCPLTVEQVAELPAVRFKWKDNGTVAVGTIAQDVRKVLPELVTERPQDGMLGVDYGVLGYLSAHTVAVKVTEHESRLQRIEKLLGIAE